MSNPDNWKRRRAKRAAARERAQQQRAAETPLMLAREHAWSCKWGLTGECSCTPTIRVEPLTGEGLRRAYENHMAWERAHLN